MVTRRAIILRQKGFGTFDALHLAWAEYLKVDVFVSTDDDLLKRASRTADIMIQVKDPVALLRELNL